ncbi:MAG TPA: beta-ketoacyl synthase N-terminal-like domain-containing protein [Myxococcota bacterium]|nr:beta-ketoacyl synthase N-terminal-like domain-containing protein [Myxococcota bacterium]HQK51437.1 beta-ketoacyl synthase N-terminal-like domain-containing protein [Myxococcota bacterium]
MEALPVLAMGQASPLGRTPDEVRAALRAGRRGLRRDLPECPELGAPLGVVPGDLPPVPQGLEAFDTRCHRLLAVALAAVQPSVDFWKERVPSHRIAVVVGTSASGNRDLERHLAAGTPEAPFDYHRRQSFGAAADFVARLLGVQGPAFTVSTACSSGAQAFVSGAGLIRSGRCDAVVVASVDALCRTTCFGFRSLGVMDPDFCRPFDANRRGLNLGEGAAAFLLARERPSSWEGPDLRLAGFGACSEAHHMTAPDPEGEGAFRAMAEALSQAGIGPEDIGYVNAHGTATPANDGSESRGIVRALGTRVPCSSTKGYTGHLLGAAAGVEAFVTLLALVDEVLPRNLGLEDLDPEVEALILREDEAAPGIRFALSNSFAFGGNDVSLVFEVRR